MIRTRLRSRLIHLKGVLAVRAAFRPRPAATCTSVITVTGSPAQSQASGQLRITSDTSPSWTSDLSRTIAADIPAGQDLYRAPRCAPAAGDQTPETVARHLQGDP